MLHRYAYSIELTQLEDDEEFNAAGDAVKQEGAFVLLYFVYCLFLVCSPCLSSTAKVYLFILYVH